ncbi:unnamed protein product [Allacma fusca]|uniref:Uncharacterized protein n=1 Tax=Allacma fusca TaxID=39272 RepID=A0A8J2KB73_9HEXA|nr:unnamed protein product [Allacma fusca]
MESPGFRKKKCGICQGHYNNLELLGRIIPIDPTASCPHVYHYLCIASNLVHNPEKRIVEGYLVSFMGTSCCPQCKISYSNIVSMTSLPPVHQASKEDFDRDVGATPLTPPPGEQNNEDENDDNLAVGDLDIAENTPIKPPSKTLTSKFYTCSGCNINYKSSKSRFRCLEKHIGPYPCPDCDTKPFKRKDYLQAHFKSVHKRSLKTVECKGINEGKSSNLKPDRFYRNSVISFQKRSALRISESLQFEE